jgi:UDP-N-acetylmuramoyl-L-alanyl-D-glutamate--2,6-diaminopimelate ligase
MAVAAGVTHAAMEASSHGLDQRRLDGVRLAAAGFTNLSQDHLDYHPTFRSYFAAKAGLFDRLLPEDGAAVINIDDARGRDMADGRRRAGGGDRGGHRPGRRSADLARNFDATGQTMRFDLGGRRGITRLT